MKTLILDNKNWQLGSSTDDESDFDGVIGLSPDIKGQNYYKSKGALLSPQPSRGSVGGTAVTDTIISAVNEPNTLLRDAIFITENGKYYYIDNNQAVTKFAEDSTDPLKYISGKTYLKLFKGGYYVSKTTDITFFSNTGGTVDFTWWTVTKAKTALTALPPHPMEVVEDTLYIADGNKIHTWDGTTAVFDQVSLDPSLTITALKIHTDGRYLKVFTTDNYTANHSDKIMAKMFLFDTTTLEFINEYSIDEQVEGAINYGGICFCTYGDNFGYFDGSGLKLIGKIEYVNGAGTSYYPIWSNLLNVFNNTIIFPSKNYMNAYGNVKGKGNITFFPVNLSGVSCLFIFPLTSSKVMLQFITPGGDYTLSTFDFSESSGYLTAQTTKIDVSSKVWIRKFTILFDTAFSTINSSLDIYNRQEDGSIVKIGNITGSVDGAITKKEFFCNVLTDFIQPYLDGANIPDIKTIHIQYESAE